jgi:hypothetical protein
MYMGSMASDRYAYIIIIIDPFGYLFAFIYTEWGISRLTLPTTIYCEPGAFVE